MKSPGRYQILTNNPLVLAILGESYLVEYREESYRQVLVRARDLIYRGYGLFTHPLAGSVKPNETPYRSLLLSKSPGELDMEAAALISEGITAFDKFSPRPQALQQAYREDFQLIDYSLLCAALDVDAAAGLSHIKQD